MRVIAMVVVAFALAGTASATSRSPQQVEFEAKRLALRAETNQCRVELGRPPFGISDRPIVSHAYRQWVTRLWTWRRAAVCGRLARVQADPRAAICLVFGSRCQEALRVAQCESRFDVNARNGQYRGTFQMGDWERATYGHGSTTLAQARAAHRYFVAAGSDWSPWSCKPWY